MGFEIFLVIGVLAAIATLFAKNRNQEINQSWNLVAEKLDISLRHAALGTSPLLSGFVEGHDLTVDIDKKRRGKSRAPFTRFRLGMTPLGLGLKLKTEGFFDGISKAFGSQDIQVGDPAFDNAVLVLGNNEAVMREFLTPERRRTVQRFLNSFSGAVITDDEISFSSKGYLRNSSEMLGTIEALLLVAQSLGEMRDDAEPATIDLQRSRAPEPAAEPEPDTELAQQDATHQLLDDTPNEAPELAEAEMPANPDISNSSAPADSPAISEFCETVFAPGTLSFDTTRIFKEKYQGKRVVWSGTLESAAPYTVDFDFGSTGGVKAVLTIDTIDSGPTGTRNLKAVIGLPVGTEGLENRIGQRLTFAGTLHKVEGFARKVVLADAELSV